MKKIILVLWVSSISVFSQLSGGDFLSLKLKGGYGYSTIGDWNSYLVYWSNSNKAFYSTTTGENKPLHYGPSLEGELSFFISPRLSIGLGAEYIYLERKAGTAKLSGFISGQLVFSLEHLTKISALPVKLTLTYFPVFGERFKFFIKAGVGYYSVDFKDTAKFHEGTPSFLDRTQEASATKASEKIGYHGGLGIEIALMPHIALLFEAEGRYAKIRGFEGSGNWQRESGSGQWSGRLYYYEWKQLDWDPWIFLESPAPSGPDYRNVRDAVVDLSGVSLKAGLVFHF